MNYDSDFNIQISKEIFEKTLALLKRAKTKSKLLDNLPETKTLTRKQIISNISSYYEKQKLVLVLGSGVSKDFGLPDWSTLLQKLMLTTIEKEREVSILLSKIFTSIFSPSPLIAGRYLQKFYLDKEMSFEEEVRKILYENINIEKPSELMNEIINFCHSPTKNHKLNSIITYNFDDVLEQILCKKGAQNIYKSIYGIEIDSENKLPIYHVHGFLQQFGELNEQNQITFGESIYHKQYTDMYSWNNIVQISKFRELNCLFIGSSLTDPNIRRLLDIARKQNKEKKDYHYTFKIRHKKETVKTELQRFLEYNSDLITGKSHLGWDLNETVIFLIKVIERFEESDAESFGVQTIWIEDWSEIPEILKAIRIE